MSTSSSADSAISARHSPGINWRAARAMLVSEGRLLLRNPGVVIWTAVLPVAAVDHPRLDSCGTQAVHESGRV